MRRLSLSRRARLSQSERADHGVAIAARLLELDEFASAGPVLAFVSISSEVPTEPLLRAVLDADRELLLPYVADDGALRAARVGSLDELLPGYRGIPEPRARIPVDPATASVAIVPGVAFDTAGGRLGYGGGFYDAFLRVTPSVARIGICYEVQLVDEVPMTEHDERVDAVVTEERTIRCPRA